MIAAPSGGLWVLYGFLLFRILHIWKPRPVGWLDARVGGGPGIMIDDVVAGIYALLILQFTAWVI